MVPRYIIYGEMIAALPPVGPRLITYVEETMRFPNGLQANVSSGI
jgi:hypothetical protein